MILKSKTPHQLGKEALIDIKEHWRKEAHCKEVDVFWIFPFPTPTKIIDQGHLHITILLPPPPQKKPLIVIIAFTWLLFYAQEGI